jgi:MFS family permease
MTCAQLLVAVGPLFYLYASKQQPYWILGAWTCWIAYIVLNIGLPNLMLKLTPDGNSPAYIAVNMATAGLAFALASILGGVLLETHRTWQTQVGGYTLDIFRVLLLLGVVSRSSTVIWFWWLLEEPERKV